MTDVYIKLGSYEKWYNMSVAPLKIKDTGKKTIQGVFYQNN